MSKLHELRKEYLHHNLDIFNLDSHPFRQFDKWFSEATKAGIEEPNVMVLSTVGANMRPSSRIVLLKEFDEQGFCFFTNYESKKGNQLVENSHASLLFFWHALERQVRIEGKVEKIEKQISDDYFKNRPIGSRIGAWASPQSKEITSREYLLEQETLFRLKFPDGQIPRPENWGGYRLIPDLLEFWQGRENRLHDRFEYVLETNFWKIRRLAP